MLIQQDLLIENLADPYSPQEFDVKRELLEIDFLSFRFLPCCINFVHLHVYIYDFKKRLVIRREEFTDSFEGSIHNSIIHKTLKLESVTPSEDLYMFTIIGTFEDILQENMVDFEGLVFGFCMVPLFKRTSASKPVENIPNKELQSNL